MNSELSLIKSEIYNRGLIIPLLESVGCHSLKINGERVDGSNPDGDNPVGFSVFLDEDLGGKIWSRNVETDDIFDMISYYKFGIENYIKIKKNLPNAKNYIIKTLGLKEFETGEYKQLPDYNFHLRKIKKKKKKEKNKVYSEKILNGITMHPPHISLIKDGLKYNLIREYEIGFDIQTERVAFVYRNIEGKIVGVRGRATKKEDEEFAKVLPIYNFSKSLELYNIHRAKDHIIKHKKVLLFEGEKSPVLAEGYGYPYSVSFMGSNISEEQAKLITSLHPTIKLIVCMDKDKSLSDIQRACKYLPKERTYAIWDQDNLLTDKESPVDVSKKVFEELLNNYCFRVFPSK